MHYAGSCHCNQVRFRLTCDPITEAMKCNCSICRRKNLVLSEPWFEAPQLEFTQGFAQLKSYLWQDKDLRHLFCPNCGVHIGASPVSEKIKVRLNLGCIDNIDLSALSIRHFNGRDLL